MVDAGRNCPGACRSGGVELFCFHITFLFFLSFQYDWKTYSSDGTGVETQVVFERPAVIICTLRTVKPGLEVSKQRVCVESTNNISSRLPWRHN